MKSKNYTVFKGKYRIIFLGIRVKEYFLSKTQKVQTMKYKIDINLTIFDSLKDIVIIVEKASNKEQIFIIHVTDKELVSRI